MTILRQSEQDAIMPTKTNRNSVLIININVTKSFTNQVRIHTQRLCEMSS